jgi:hypothetical protein
LRATRTAFISWYDSICLLRLRPPVIFLTKG